MEASIEGCYEKFGKGPIRIGAQYHLSKFYNSLGFEEEGEVEDEAEGSERPKTDFKVSPPQGGQDVSTTVPDAEGNQQVIEPNSAAFDPNANEPIKVENINPTKKTPADVFIESAQVGVGAMAAGAAILGVTAAVRGSRFRRQSKTDFIYEVETKE